MPKIQQTTEEFLAQLKLLTGASTWNVRQVLIGANWDETEALNMLTLLDL